MGCCITGFAHLKPSLRAPPNILSTERPSGCAFVLLQGMIVPSLRHAPQLKETCFVVDCRYDEPQPFDQVGIDRPRASPTSRLRRV